MKHKPIRYLDWILPESRNKLSADEIAYYKNFMWEFEFLESPRRIKIKEYFLDGKEPPIPIFQKKNFAD